MHTTFRTISLAVALLCLGCTSAFAQLKRFSIGPYIETGAPAGNFHDNYQTGWGGGLNADIKLIAGFGVTGSAGFMHFTGKTVTSSPDPLTGQTVTQKNPAINALPLRLGVKYHFFPLLYAKIEGGVANFIGDKYKTGAAAIFSPGIGIRILMLDAQVKYEIWSRDGSNGFWGLKVGLNF
ncbi:MAG TPA: hypothetical protein VGC22_07285 [Chitinophaga sp.]